MGRLSLGYRVETHALAAPFRISGYVFEASDVVVVELDRRRAQRPGRSGGRLLSRRRCRRTSSPSSRRTGGPIEACDSREELRELMPRGGARNAVDCAMWELEAKRGGTAARQLAGIDAAAGRWSPPSRSAPTTRKSWPKARADYAGAQRDQGQADRRARARRRAGARRSARRGPTSGSASTPTRASSGTDLDRAGRGAGSSSGVSLLEQPLPRGREADLDGYRSPDSDRRRRKRARPRRRRRRWSAASTSSTSSSTSAAA